jgi:hypothetical protein
MGRGAVITVIQHHHGKLVNSSRQAGVTRTCKPAFGKQMTSRAITQVQSVDGEHPAFLFDRQGLGKIIHIIVPFF